MAAKVFSIFVALLTAASVQAATVETNVTPSAPVGAPKFEEIHKALTKRLWDASCGDKKTYDYKSLTFRNAFRIGSTVMYPMVVDCNITTHFPGGVLRTERKHQIFEFYRNQYGLWEFYLQGNLD